MGESTYNVFADYFQILLRDANADWEDLAEKWTATSVSEMFVQGDGWVAIGTARNMFVPVTVATADEEPALDLAPWDRIVDSGIALPSGQLIVSGVTDNGRSGGEIKLPAGAYRLRALYLGLNTLSSDGLNGNDRYVIQLWPLAGTETTPTQPRVVKS